MATWDATREACRPPSVVGFAHMFMELPQVKLSVLVWPSNADTPLDRAYKMAFSGTMRAAASVLFTPLGVPPNISDMLVDAIIGLGATFIASLGPQPGPVERWVAVREAVLRVVAAYRSDRIIEAFRNVFARAPTTAELTTWCGFDFLWREEYEAAMREQKAQQLPGVTGPVVPPAPSTPPATPAKKGLKKTAAAQSKRVRLDQLERPFVPGASERVDATESVPGTTPAASSGGGGLLLLGAAAAFALLAGGGGGLSGVPARSARGLGAAFGARRRSDDDAGGGMGLVLGAGAVAALLLVSRKTSNPYSEELDMAPTPLPEGFDPALDLEFDLSPATVTREQFAAGLPVSGRPYADAIWTVAQEMGVDPFIIAGIMERETAFGTSRFLDKKGPAGRGDEGHGHGLMQIDDRFHGPFLGRLGPGGVPLWQVPVENIRYAIGTVFLPDRAYFQRNAGGPIKITSTIAADWKTRKGITVAVGTYADKRPLQEPKLTATVLAAYNAGKTQTLRAVAAGVDPDKMTTGGDYGADVLTRAARMRRASGVSDNSLV